MTTIIKMKTPGENYIPVNVIEESYKVINQSTKRPQYVSLVDESGLDVLSELIKERIEHKYDCPVLVTGDRGLGKSTLILKTAQYIDPNFNIEDICFRLEEFDHKFNENAIGDGSKSYYPQIVMDEAGYALFAKEWMIKEQRILAKELIVSRIKCQTVWFAVPRREDLNSTLRDMPYIWVHISTPKEFLQGYAEVRLAPPMKQSPFFKGKYWEPKFAFTYTALKGEFWDKYEEKKLKFVNEVTADTASGQSDSRIHIRDKMIKEYYWYRKKHGDPITVRDLGGLINIGHSTIVKIING